MNADKQGTTRWKAGVPDAISVALAMEVANGASESRAMAAVLARSALPETWDSIRYTRKRAV
jgi:hypothetical protein